VAVDRDVRRDDLERDGFVVLEDALEPETVERLTAAVERVRRAESPNGDAFHRLAFLGLDDAFLDLVDHPAVLPLVCDVLGWNVYVYHCHLDVHPPLPADAKPQWRWHQDGGRQNVELSSPRPRLSLKVAWFLTDVSTTEHGALRLVPGSHTRGVLPRDREPPDAIPLLVRAGAAVVLDRRLWHARGDNRSDMTRRVLFYAYTHRWIRPRDELGIDAARVAALDPVRRQLLGWGTSAIGHWIPTDEDVPLRDAIQNRVCASTSSATWRASPGS
jgi:ectoine hydroxylase-related dioxygenase (phytanoyl-CoA dioxygenase family)